MTKTELRRLARKLPETIKVRVGKRDIKAGKPAFPTQCPIAHATTRTFSRLFGWPVVASVSFGARILTIPRGRQEHTTLVYYDLDKVGNNFINRFDEEKSVKPVTVTLTRGAF